MSVPPSVNSEPAVAYLRDSGHEDQELSTGQQYAVLQQYAAEYAIPILHWFIDAAAPGSTTIGRRQFLEMIDYLRDPNCPAKTLLIWSYSRFARDIDDAQYFKADLRRRGITIQSITDPVPAGLDGRFFESAIDWMNAKYLESLATDIKRGQRHILQTHYAIGGLPPLGFKRQQITIGQRRDGRPHIVSRWVIDPAQVDTVRLAFRLRAQGASYGEIHEKLHLFRALNSYKHFFANQLYIGIMQFGDLTLPGYCDPLIDPDTWSAVQSRFRAPNTTRPRRDPNALLGGLAHCARCGSPLNADYGTAKGHKYEYYICSRRHRRRDCDAPKIPRPDLDRAVLHTLAEYILSPQVIETRRTRQQLEQQERQHQLQERRASLNHRLAALRRQIDNLTTIIAEDGTRSLVEKLRTLETQETAALAELTELNVQATTLPAAPPDLSELPARIRQLMETADTPALRSILIGFVQRVTVERIGAQLAGIISYYDPPVVATGECPRRETHHAHNLYTCRIIQPI